MTQTVRKKDRQCIFSKQLKTNDDRIKWVTFNLKFLIKKQFERNIRNLKCMRVSCD